jgi:hypothetical protein
MKPKYIMIQATETEKDEIKRDAHAHNMNVSEYIRYLVAKERKERENERVEKMSVLWKSCV